MINIKGIYCLVIKVSKDISIIAGKLGKIRFKKGYYAYVGSAQKNMEKRISRHLKKEKNKFWHIDYLLENPNANIQYIFCKKGKKDQECKTAKKIKEIGDPVKNFGSSDCKCESHLFKIKNVRQLKILFNSV